MTPPMRPTPKEIAEIARRIYGEQDDVMRAADLAFAEALLARLPKGWACKARPTADPPQDCAMPFCGCNPAWQDALASAQESGWLTLQEADALRADVRALAEALARFKEWADNWAESYPDAATIFKQTDQYKEMVATLARPGVRAVREET
jgi:hypothetical protein